MPHGSRFVYVLRLLQRIIYPTQNQIELNAVHYTIELETSCFRTAYLCFNFIIASQMAVQSYSLTIHMKST